MASTGGFFFIGLFLFFVAHLNPGLYHDRGLKGSRFPQTSGICPRPSAHPSSLQGNTPHRFCMCGGGLFLPPHLHLRETQPYLHQGRRKRKATLCSFPTIKLGFPYVNSRLDGDGRATMPTSQHLMMKRLLLSFPSFITVTRLLFIPWSAVF
ncbi:hypothetical protein QBC36DRAFT_61544 [Triangularia setosa]|uniref:Uncharacterized protein n=1 Tax=Triangularia setosa TaxID=2587417 RepID=A0AAN6W1I7_9PEZI|nr:hypothetical protein QBC36DRAFT_61544 [Podospora setosa]